MSDESPPDPPDPPESPRADGSDAAAPVEAIAILASSPRRRVRRRPKWGRILMVLVVLALPFFAAAGWFWYQVDPPGEPGARVTVDIPEGAGVGQIADRLEARGVVGSAFAFRWYARLSGDDSFQTGRYELRRDLGARGAARALGRGPTQSFQRLALPPGLRFDEVAERIGALPGRDAGRVRQIAASGVVRSRYQPANMNSLEGLTWPETYFVADHEDEEEILRTIVRTFDDNATELGLDQASDPYRSVIAASLIEREAGVDEDRPLIAAVLENRLRDEMLLQIDATVVYARGGGDRSLTDADFALDSPYNTYVVVGLPPTPISTVTAASLRAALAPADVPFKFYVLTESNGKHAFAVTFAEHEANIADARRRGVLP